MALLALIQEGLFLLGVAMLILAPPTVARNRETRCVQELACQWTTADSSLRNSSAKLSGTSC